MDKSRLADMARLQAVIDNPYKSQYARDAAARTKQIIIKQSKDRKLTKFREMLIRAAEEGNELEEWKISCQMRDYLRKEKFER